MRCLVTGASGLLGAYVLRELTGSGAEVVAWSGSTTGRLFGVDLQPVELGEPESVAAALERARPDVVVRGRSAVCSPRSRAHLRPA